MVAKCMLDMLFKSRRKVSLGYFNNKTKPELKTDTDGSGRIRRAESRRQLYTMGLERLYLAT